MGGAAPTNPRRTAIASVARRPDGRWRARYRGPDGRERAQHFRRKVDAERWLAEVEVSRSRGTWTSPEDARITFEAWAERWLAGQHHLKPSTRARYEGLLRLHVIPAFGPTALADIRHGDVVAWAARLSDQGLAASSVRQAHRVCSLVLSLAVQDGRLARNPADRVRLPRARTDEKRFLTHAEVEHLADECGPYRLAVLTLAYAGLRFGELSALRVRDVDLARRRLTIARAAAEVNGHLIVGTPKAHHQRSVPVPRFLADELAIALDDRAPDELAFPAPRGGMLRNHTFRRGWFDDAATRAGLGDLTPHELRHTAASLAVTAGATVKAVQLMLGHASAAMTLDVYSGLFADDLDLVAERLHDHKINSTADRVRTEAELDLDSEDLRGANQQ